MRLTANELAREAAATGFQAEPLEKVIILLVRFGLEPGSCGLACELVCGESHATSAHVRPRTSSGTMRFQDATSFPGLRRASRYRGCRGRSLRSRAK